MVLFTLLNSKVAPETLPTVSVAGATGALVAVTPRAAPSATVILPEPDLRSLEHQLAGADSRQPGVSAGAGQRERARAKFGERVAGAAQTSRIRENHRSVRAVSIL